MAFSLVLAQIVMPVQAAFATADPAKKSDKLTKSYVCKAVNTPGAGEVFQTGNNPISVDRKDEDVIGAQFNDAQGNSFVVGFGYPSEPQDEQPTIEDCFTLVTPIPEISTTPCTPGVVGTDTVNVKLTNNDGVTGNTVIYTVTINGQTKSTAALVDGATETLVFTSLAAGTYPVTVAVYGGTVFTGLVTVNACNVVTPPTPLAPTAVASVEACTPESGMTDIVNVTVTNTDDATNASVTYSVVIGSQTKSITLADGASGSVTFEGLSAGTYTAVVTGTDGTVTTNPVIVAVCTKTPREPQPCTVSNNTFVAPWTYDEETYPFAGAWPEEGVPATATFTEDGLYLTTPAIESYTLGFIDAGNTYLSDINAMSYRTMRESSSTGHSQTLPAYILYVDEDGDITTDDTTYFFYEPYYNGAVLEDTWQTWNLTGSAKWYVSGTGQALKTWDELVALYPDAKALAYGYNQGTSNLGANTYIAYMDFDCARTAFIAGSGEQEPNPPVVPDVPVVPVVPVIPVVPVAPSAALPAELPYTGPAEAGSAEGLLFALVAAAATYGAVYFAQPKRRYE